MVIYILSSILFVVADFMSAIIMAKENFLNIFQATQPNSIETDFIVKRADIKSAPTNNYLCFKIYPFS
ncbi:hypothetical protein B0187_09075 [Haemophilus paracuniculus]|uniref:Uncharacterized protein n=1 Tax=Haemophilus paracuniculus TaxID=734 RepID=A0A1T0AQ67_9PAST|nr:hypothetical protein B0187_09075 [Haemophilus paracuniculus]